MRPDSHRYNGLAAGLVCVFLWLLLIAAANAAQLSSPDGGSPGTPSATRAATDSTPEAVPSRVFDSTPRIAIMSAFAPELALLKQKLQQSRTFEANGVVFTTGKLEGQPVVLALSGISMVNAAMNTQLVFDRFVVSHLIFSGIAGGVNPDLHIGDVSVPVRWGQYLEVVMMREVAPGKFQAPASKGPFKFAPYGIMQPRVVRVRRPGQTRFERRFWFDVDPEMLAVARRIRHVSLRACDDESQCLSPPPRLVVGGNGVSGQAFVDNADFRRYVFHTFDANVLDMESAACAMVAYSNNVPFIAFRSLSDLAGGGPGENEMTTFIHLAADNAAKVLLAFLHAWRDA